MARVARSAGRRGRTIPAPRPPLTSTRSDARLVDLSSPTWTLGSGHGPGVTGSTFQGEDGRVRRTAAMISVGALVFLAGCGNADGASMDAAAGAPDAQVTLAVPDGSADGSAGVPLEITVTDGELGDVSLVDDAGATVTGTVAAEDGTDAAVWTPEAPLDYGTEYTLTASAVNEDDEEVTASSTFTTVTPETLS